MLLCLLQLTMMFAGPPEKEVSVRDGWVSARLPTEGPAAPGMRGPRPLGGLRPLPGPAIHHPARPPPIAQDVCARVIELEGFIPMYVGHIRYAR